MNVLMALGLIALGMGLDALYHRRIRIAECDAYETGYQQGLKEEKIREEARSPNISFSCTPFDATKHQQKNVIYEMPPTFEDRMRKHGRAVVKLK